MSIAAARAKANASVITRLADTQMHSMSGIVTGIFTTEYVESNFSESQKPVFTALSDDLSIVDHGEIVSINNSDYKVVNVRPNGTGITALILELQ